MAAEVTMMGKKLESKRLPRRQSAVGAFSDAELARAIKEGVKEGGKER